MNNKKILILSFIILLAAVLRFYHLSYADAYTDEVIFGFRAIGLIDYNAAYTQTTPWQWFADVPGWAHLSFHDHPPVFFWLQNWSLHIFGENTLGLRFPSAVAGLASVFLVFLLARRLVSLRAAYIALALLSVQSHHVWISRIGLQDSVVVFFMLLTLWLWLLAWEKQKKYLWWLWGLSLGLGIMTKYTILIIVPILLVQAIIFRLKFYSHKNFWLALALAFLVTLPIILYNLFLYGAVGHFDFQISALLGQDAPQWAVRLGREKVGDLGQRLIGFFVVFQRANTRLFNIFSLLSWLGAVIFYWKNRQRQLLFLVLVPILLWLWFLLIGSTDRFVVMLVPWLVMLLAYLGDHLLSVVCLRKIIYGFLAVWLVIEALFTINSFLRPVPYGRVACLYSQLVETNKNFGFNQLDKYLDELLAGKYAVATGQPQYSFLSDLQVKSLTDKRQKGFEPWSVVIIYDQRIFSAAKLWTLQRRLIYDGWIVMSDQTFISNTGDELAEYYRQQGIENFIYIKALNTNDYPLDPAAHNLVAEAEVLEIMQGYLNKLGINPEIIKNSQNQEAFAIYKF